MPPLWYREGLPEVLTLFSQTFSVERPANLRLLPSFPTPEFDSDGVHLTAYSGLEYIVHLFDAAEEIISNFKSSPEEVLVQSCESTRVLEDRMMVLEQDHRRLNGVVEGKTAADAELDDFHANERFLDSFVIHGLAPISSRINPELLGMFNLTGLLEALILGLLKLSCEQGVVFSAWCAAFMNSLALLTTVSLF